MKFRTLFTLIFIFSLFIGHAQVKPFRFGVKVAPDLSWLSPDVNNYENDGSSIGFTWGFMADITLTDNYFIKTGFNMDYLGGKLKYPHQMALAAGEDPETGTLYRKYNLRYLEIPLTIKMRTNKFNKTAYFGEIGFGGAFNLKARAKDKFTYSGQTTPEVENDIKEDINFMKASLIVGGGIEYFVDESTSLLFSLNFNNGLTDILKGENAVDPDIKDKAILYFFQFNVGVMF